MSVNLFSVRLLNELKGEETLKLSSAVCSYKVSVFWNIVFASRNRRLFKLIALGQRIYLLYKRWSIF